MKRLYLLVVIFLMGGFLSFQTVAQSQTVNEMDMAYETVPATFSMNNIKQLLERMSTNPSGEEDLLLNMLLATPYEKRQYVFPQLHENRALSKKILTHPEIAVWKGKMPTNLPPQLKDYAAQYLPYLPPIYYLYLDPDLWVAKEKDKPQSGPLELSPRNAAIHLMPHKGEFYTYPSLTSLYKLNPQTLKNYKKTDLKPQDVTRVLDSVKGLEDYIENQNDPTELKHGILSLMVRNNQIEKDFIDPFASLVARLKKLKPQEEIDTLFKNMGWKNADDFALTADRILKAQRVSTLNPTIAIQLQKVRGYPDNPKNEMLNNLKMFARMHEAAPGDVYFVAPYAEEIRKQLKPKYILLLGTPVYIE